VAGVVAVAVAIRRRGVVLRAPSAALAEAVRKVRRCAPDERGALAVQATQARTWEGDLARALLDASDQRERVDAASEAVGDLATAYGATSRWTLASVRIVLFIGMILVAVGLASANPIGAVASFVVAALGAGLTHSIGLGANQVEKVQRELADAWIELLVGRIPERKRRL